MDKCLICSTNCTASNKCSYCDRRYCEECQASYDILHRKVFISFMGWVGINICNVCILDQPKWIL